MAKSQDELFFLRGAEINAATDREYRQYFCGNLQRPQLLDFIRTESLEVGTSRYDAFTADEPHLHTETPDMIYLLSGAMRILLLEEGRELTLAPGDFLSIPPNTPYASKSAPGTRTLFIKQVRASDKRKVEPDAALLRWMARWEAEK